MSQVTIRQRVLRLGLCAGLLLTAAAPPAQAGDILQNLYDKHVKKYFGVEEKTGPRPEDTLIAPFAEKKTDTPVARGKLPDYAAKATPLDEPHRTIHDLADWLNDVLADLFTVDPRRYASHLRVHGARMDEFGLEDYSTFMAESGLIGKLQNEDLTLRAFTENKPLMLKEGVLKGRYRWVYETSLLLSFIPRGLTSYEGVSDRTLDENPRIIVRVQLGRVAEGGEEGVIIEGLKARFAKKE